MNTLIFSRLFTPAMDAENYAAPANAGDITKSYKSNARTCVVDVIRLFGHKLMWGAGAAPKPAPLLLSTRSAAAGRDGAGYCFRWRESAAGCRHRIELLAMCTSISRDAGTVLIAAHAGATKNVKVAPTPRRFIVSRDDAETCRRAAWHPANR
jgi:hypothetical protein